MLRLLSVCYNIPSAIIIGASGATRVKSKSDYVNRLKVAFLNRIAEHSSIQVDDLLLSLLDEIFQAEKYNVNPTHFFLDSEHATRYAFLQQRAVEILLDIYARESWIVFRSPENTSDINPSSILRKPSAYVVAIHPRGAAFLHDGVNPNSPYDARKNTRQNSQPNADKHISELVEIKEKAYRKPRTEAEAKDKIAGGIASRRGQQDFRKRLLDTYKHCLVTGSDIEEVLEAAHIQPYHQEGTFGLPNGLLLRADIHTLFDLGLLSIDSITMTVLIALSLEQTTYAPLKGGKLLLPPDHQNTPDKLALDIHRREVFGKSV